MAKGPFFYFGYFFVIPTRFAISSARQAKAEIRKIHYTLYMPLNTYQHFPQILNPIAFSLGPVQVSWYGIMYLVAFAVVYFLVRCRIRTEKLNISLETVREFFPWAIIGLLAGARLGDVFIYYWAYFKNNF